MGEKIHVRANPQRLAPGWQTDEYLQHEVHATIRRMIRDGASHSQTARIVGCSSRTVGRVMTRDRSTSKAQFCGAPNGRSDLDHETCHRLVTGDVRCKQHREKEEER